MQRRVFLRGVAGLSAATVAVAGLACGPASSVAPGQSPAGRSRTFKIAYFTLGWAGMELIHQLRLLDEQGWSIEWHPVDVINGVVNAFSSGQVDLIDMASVIAAQMYEQGVNLRVFGAGVGTLGGILVAPNSTIQSVPELRGRKVGGIPGGSTPQDINASVRKIYNLDVFTETQFVQGTTPADMVNLLTRDDVEAVLVWEPVISQLVRSGAARILATQQQLWEQASGSRATPVHVVYLTTPRIAADSPDLLQDINAAQAQVAELWKQRDPRAVQGMQQVPHLPVEVVEDALGRTTPLSGLGDQAIDTILEQLRFDRQFGTLLQTDVWTEDPARARGELFVPTRTA
jgi:NitT/TauT family transport system substrate-binding protein